MDRRARLTPVGAVVLGLLAVAIVAVFVGSRTLQAVGFVVIVVIVLVLLADQLPRLRVFGKTPADTLPTPETATARRRPARGRSKGAEDPRDPSGRSPGPTGRSPGPTERSPGPTGRSPGPTGRTPRPPGPPPGRT